MGLKQKIRLFLDLLLLSVCVIPASSYATAINIPENRRSEMIDFAHEVIDGNDALFHSLPQKEKEWVFSIASRILNDSEEEIALSDRLTGFDYGLDSNLPEINGQYYPTQWKFPFCGTWRLTCGYDCWVYGRNTHSNSDDFALDWSTSNAGGQPVLAPADGWVLWSGWAGDYGVVIIIDHGNNVVSRLAHLRDDSSLILQTR